MRRRALGRTGIDVPHISFGCGGTAGLMIRGDAEERKAVVAESMEKGIDFFDTSPLYGGGHSEANLGQVLQSLGKAPIVSTKIDFAPEDAADLKGAAERSVRRSLERLGRDHLDILYIHSRVGRRRDLAGRVLTVADVLDDGGIASVLEGLQKQGLVRAIGFTALGHTDSVLEVLRSERFDVIQAYYNLINPSAVMPSPAAWRAQDYEQLAQVASDLDIGVVAIRVLAAGALSDDNALHPLAKQYSSLSKAEVDADRARGAAFRSLAPDGDMMTRFALRYALSDDVFDSVLVGVSERSHLEEAVAAAAAGPLPAATLTEIEQRFRELYETA
nr:aldo/keto reductase [Sphingomonas sp. CDS-1]